MSVRTLCDWLDSVDPEFQLEAMLSKLRIAVLKPVDWDSSLIQTIWASTLFAEIFRVLYTETPDKEHDISAVLIRFSERYAQQLPCFSIVEAHQELSSLVSSSLLEMVSTLHKKPLRSIQALAPYQVPPRNFSQWCNWNRIPQLGPQAWEVLRYYAIEQEEWAQVLLSEGNGQPIPPWNHVPILERLYYLGRVDVTPKTLRVLRICCVEVWQEQPREDFLWHPSDQEVLLAALQRCRIQEDFFSMWIQPSSIAQQLVQHGQPYLANCAMWFLERSRCDQSLQQLFYRMKNWALTEVIFVDGLIRCGMLQINAQDCTKEDFQHSLSLFVLRVAARLYQCEYPMALQELWKNNVLGLGAEAFTLLVKNLDREVLMDWYSTAPELSLRLHEVLSKDSKYLRLAWRLDRKGRRRKEMLSFAVSNQKLPQWAFIEVQKELRDQETWPAWISPYRSELLEIVSNIAERAQGIQQIWWSSIVHRHQHGHPIFIQALHNWALKDPQPLGYSAHSAHEFLSISSTPIPSSRELLQWLMGLKSRPSWFSRAISRLWEQACKKQEEAIALILLNEIENREELFFTGWEKSSKDLSARLLKIWLETASIKEVRSLYDQNPQFQDQLERHLLQIKEPQILEDLSQDFIASVSEKSFRTLLQASPESMCIILDKAWTNNPHKQQLILQLVARWVENGSQHTHILLWLRRHV